ncbi:trinucleotide repeat-containing gene 18 protein-like [Anopheles funestus]|uniref:Uncharacterized protein n=1 Tax=Anopheles funestus TaxID=62324 RepID=A0A4Y0BNC8_ANOFN|nr:trinucleotide repeat-containing gene 18 protein-like [Anopheles funestus]
MDTYRGGRSVTLLLLLVLTVVRIDSLPVSSFLDDDSDYDDSFENEYDLVFDQRQNGTANVHVSVDGVMLAIPGPEMPPSASLAGATLLDLFASQLAAGGESEYESSEESYGSISGTSSTAAGASSSTSSTTSTTTVAPASDALIASDFPYQGLPANLPASLLGQGLSFFFNPKHAEIPFHLNTAQGSTKQTIPLLITKMDKAPATRDPDSAESNEDSRELAAPAPQQTPKQQAGKKKRKHKRKYKVRVANLLRPLLKRTILVQ